MTLMANASTLDNRRFLVGAATGTGMTAKAAAQGGADFLLALNAGRLRVQGGPSISCMLPLADNNRARVARVSNPFRQARQAGTLPLRRALGGLERNGDQ